MYDDHCRSCHKLGDLLCCETCPATYHLECVNPPLKAVPDHDWQCEICRVHQVSGGGAGEEFVVCTSWAKRRGTVKYSTAPPRAAMAGLLSAGVLASMILFLLFY